MFFRAPQVWKLFYPSEGIEPLKYASGTFLDNELAGIARMLYALSSESSYYRVDKSSTTILIISRTRSVITLTVQ